ncbi:MAG: nitroreductase family protein [Victivallales bacterium]|nr:nitroreductase family protein [Victivallales bacterium]
MEFYDVITTRRSIRGYQADPIPEASLQRIANAINLAPSACNRQPWRFEIVMNPEYRARIGAVYRQPWLLDAPAIVLAIGNRDTCWKRLEGTPVIDIDIAIAMEHMVLAATAEGLATCWICAYDQARMNAAAGVTAPWEVLAISPLGYGNVAPAAIARKSPDETVTIIR